MELHCGNNVSSATHYSPMSAKINIWLDICQISNNWLCNIPEKEYRQSGNETGVEHGLGMRLALT